MGVLQCYLMMLQKEPKLGVEGAPETAFNGTLMLGMFLAVMLLLNEGAKGMWRMMIPVIIGFSALTASIWLHGDFTDASETPKYATLFTILYTAAYFLLRMKESTRA